MGILTPNFEQQGPGVEKDELSKEGLPLLFPLLLTLTFSMVCFISSFTAWIGIKKFIIK